LSTEIDTWDKDIPACRSIKYDKIVALLKAFDLYADSQIDEEKVKVIAGFLTGNFILTRNEKEGVKILQELLDLLDAKTILDEYLKGSNKSNWLLRICFEDLLGYRKRLNNVGHYSYYRSEYSFSHDFDYFEFFLQKTFPVALLRKLSINELIRQKQRIDDILLKIIGEKEPVSESELIEKYGFPEQSECDVWIEIPGIKELLAQL
jgi:hypothetical protein